MGIYLAIRRARRSRGSAAPAMMTKPCDLQPPASAGRPAVGQGTIDAVMLITGSSASSGSRARGSRSYLADCVHEAPAGAFAVLCRCLAAPAGTHKNPDPALHPRY